VEPGDLVRPIGTVGQIGLVLEKPFMDRDCGAEVVKVDWLGYDLIENYSTYFLEVISEGK